MLAKLVTYMCVAVCFLVVVAGLLLRKKMRNMALRNGADVYSVGVLSISAPFIISIFLLGLIVAMNGGFGIHYVYIISSICIVLCAAAAIQMQNRVELYKDFCVSISGGRKFMLYYKDIMIYNIIGERGSLKASFQSFHNKKFYFYNSIPDFDRIVGYISGKSKISNSSRRSE